MPRFMVTAREYFDLPSRVADASRPEITDEAAVYHEWLVGPALPGRPRGWRARQVGVDPADVHGPAEAPAEGGPPVLARAEWGRWIGDCPDCPGAAYLLGDRFMCGGCFNASAGYRYRVVTWPPSEERAAIEAVLLERPTPDARNWDARAAERVEALLEENIAHGVPVPVTLAHRLDRGASAAGDGAVRVED